MNTGRVSEHALQTGLHCTHGWGVHLRFDPTLYHTRGVDGPAAREVL